MDCVCVINNDLCEHCYIEILENAEQKIVDRVRMLQKMINSHKMSVADPREEDHKLWAILESCVKIRSLKEQGGN